MGKLCICLRKQRSQRRLNGAQLPLNWQQVTAWVVFIATALVNFIIIVEIQFHELKIVSIITYAVLYVSHFVTHATALLTDPAERDLRRLKVTNVPEFDRSLHAHVIENGRCHICNIYTSSKRTKHCSLCNKCVDRFDHHCKWLNNCVGQRNYYAFIACVVTAVIISVFTCSLCLTDIVLFLSHPTRLSSSAQSFFTCTPLTDSSNERYCTKAIAFLVFLITYCVSSVTIACVLLHLYCFHVYISLLGVSTYEYIVKGGTSAKPHLECRCGKGCMVKPYVVRKQQTKSSRHHVNGDSLENNTTPIISTGMLMSSNSNSPDNVTNLVGNLISNELGKTKRTFIYDKNKVHPQTHNEVS